MPSAPPGGHWLMGTPSSAMARAYVAQSGYPQRVHCVWGKAASIRAASVETAAVDAAAGPGMLKPCAPHCGECE